MVDTDRSRGGAGTWATSLNRDARTVLGAALRRRRGPFAEQLKRVTPKLAVPRLTPARSIWAIAMVKNEADIIEATVRHLASQGVEHFLVMDNGSTDDTPAILRALSESIPGFHHGTDAEPAHYQGAKMTVLADAVRRAGATWVLPFDADEYWYGVNGTVAETLGRSRAQVVEARMHNVFPTTEGGWQVDDAPQLLNKVAFKASRTATLTEGNHGVARRGGWAVELRILHLPIRSYEQFRRKVTGGAEALALTALPAGAGRHWRQAATACEADLREQWCQAMSGTVPAMGLAPAGNLAPLGKAVSPDWPLPGPHGADTPFVAGNAHQQTDR